MSEKQAQAYGLGGNTLAGARLNLQHHFTTDLFDGRLLDPKIPLDRPNLTVADVCTGTGIWLTQLADQLPHSCTLGGLDINLTQQPPMVWFSTDRMSFRHFDLHVDLPDQFVERYDVINIQYALMFVTDDAFPDTLRKLIRMLKPGGYLQWTDFDLANSHPIVADPSYKPHQFGAIEAIFLTCALTGRQPPKWTSNSQALFASEGLKDVKHIIPPYKASTVQSITQCDLWGMSEACDTMVSRIPDLKDKADVVRELVGKGWWELHEKGIGVNTRTLRCVGRKA